MLRNKKRKIRRKKSPCRIVVAEAAAEGHGFRGLHLIKEPHGRAGNSRKSCKAHASSGTRVPIGNDESFDEVSTVRPIHDLHVGLGNIR